MKIIHVPNVVLRQKAEPITQVDKKLHTWLDDLAKTLKAHKNPVGVGLAAPQVELSKSAFITYLPKDPNAEKGSPLIQTFINPQIVDHSTTLTFGEDPEHPIVEGCLSIPHLYGAVPRWEWIELNYQVIQEDELVDQSQRFTDFAARVVQHENDHLHGILFTDYSLQLDLPVYFSKKGRDDQMEEVDKTILESF